MLCMCMPQYSTAGSRGSCIAQAGSSVDLVLAQSIRLLTPHTPVLCCCCRYVIVMRPLRQGRLKLALEELLSTQVEGPEALPSEPPASSFPEVQVQLGGQRFSTLPKHSSANLLGRNSVDRSQTGGIWPIVPGTSNHLRLAHQVSLSCSQRMLNVTYAAIHFPHFRRPALSQQASRLLPLQRMTRTLLPTWHPASSLESGKNLALLCVATAHLCCLAVREHCQLTAVRYDAQSALGAVQARKSGSGELQAEATKSTSVLLAEDNIINLRVSWGCSESAVFLLTRQIFPCLPADISGCARLCAVRLMQPLRACLFLHMLPPCQHRHIQGHCPCLRCLCAGGPRYPEAPGLHQHRDGDGWAAGHGQNRARWRR